MGCAKVLGIGAGVMFGGIMALQTIGESAVRDAPTPPPMSAAKAVLDQPTDQPAPELTHVEKRLDDYAIVRQADAMSAKGQGTGVAMLLNLNGELCAEVISAKPQGTSDRFVVTCKEYRGRKGVVQYVFDASDGEVSAL